MSMSAGEALAGAAMAALRALAGLNGVYEGRPVQAAAPYGLVETGPELDWSHKSGTGRELRLAVVLRGKGERPAGLRALAGEAEAAVEGLAGEIGGWRLVSLVFMRSRLVAEAPGAWVAVSEFRARLLKV